MNKGMSSQKKPLYINSVIEAEWDSPVAERLLEYRTFK
jgi:hypothetical protein